MPHPRKPISEEQLAANRANATQSTGPRTPEGKARSAQNARKHGFTAAVFAVVRLEDLDEVANLKADLVAVYQPINTQELCAIERIALAQQSLLRAARLEAGLFTTCLNEFLDSSGQPFFPMSPELVGDGDIETTRAQNRNYALAEGFQRMAKAANTWSLFLRYQAQSERLYRRAVEELERLQALRPNLPNEPISPGQPEPNETISTPGETNPFRPQESVPAPSPTATRVNGKPRARHRTGQPVSCRTSQVARGHALRKKPAIVNAAGHFGSSIAERSRMQGNSSPVIPLHCPLRPRIL
jgi:hypothetical protein